VGGVEVEPIAVDHSVPGAYGFIIHTSEGVIVYTGDFRTHGVARSLTERFLSRVKALGGVDVMICEGTNFGEAKVFSEGDVEVFSRSLIEQSLKGGCSLIVVEVPQADIDRVRTIYQICAELGVKPLVSKRLAYYLHELSTISETFTLPGKPLPKLGEGLGIYVDRRYPARRDRVFSTLEGSYAEHIYDRARIEEEVEGGCLIFDADEIDWARLAPKPGTLCILSTCEPFTEEADFDFERWRNQLALRGVILYHIHSSGHIHPLELKRVVEEVKPRRLIPIHTEYPGMFKELFEGGGIEVRLPQKGVPIQIGGGGR